MKKISKPFLSAPIKRWLTGGERVKPLPVPVAIGSFSRRLAAACPVRGDIPRLCKALNLTDMSVRHWLWGDTLPPPQTARRIAVYLGWDPEKTVVELEAECAERATVTIRRRYQGTRVPGEKYLDISHKDT